MFVSFLTGLLRSPYDRFMYDFSPKIIIKKNRAITARYSQNLRTMYPTTYLRATVPGVH